MNVLFLTHRLPYAPDRGDRIRAYHTIRVLSRTANVDLLSLVHDRREASRANELATITSSVTLAPISATRQLPAAGMAMLRGRPLTHALLDSPVMQRELARVVRERKPDVVLAYCSGMARFALTPPLSALPFVLDMVDVDSAKWAALAVRSGVVKGWIYQREARCLSGFEAIAAKRARMTLVVNERERALLRQIAPEAEIRVMSVGVDAAFFAPPGPPTEDPTVVFCGVMDYAPNVEGVLWLMREVWPIVRATVPAARLLIVGSAPAARLVAAAASESSVTVTGLVPDVRPYLWRSAIGVAPLLTARGVQTKVFEATAAGLPSVVTSVVYEGLPPDIRRACTTADTAEAFAAAILALLDERPDARRARAAAANAGNLSWERQLSELAPILQQAAAHQRP